MSILLLTGPAAPQRWVDALKEGMSPEEVRTWPVEDGLERIEAAVVMKPVPGLLATLPHLKLITSVGMGVEHIMADATLPKGVPIARVVDPEMTDQMAEYVCLSVLRVERDSDKFDAAQKAKEWPRRFAGRPGGKLTVGLLGLGAVGAECARRLSFLGFPVVGWSRTARSMPGVEGFHGADGLPAMLARTHILVNILPLTAETANLLNRDTLSRLPKGAHVVNVARGEHIVDEDLLALLDEGHLGGATLDVFRKEPPPPEHPFWTHPRIRMTPHSAGLADPMAAGRIILGNLERVRRGERPNDEVIRDRGY